MTLARYILLLLPLFGFAQPPKLDSLENLARTSKDDTLRIQTLNTLSRQYINIGEYSKALNFASQAMTNAAAYKGNGRVKDQMLAQAFNNLGIIYRIQGDHARSLEQHLQALRLRERINDQNGIGASLNNIANVYKIQGNLPKALETFKRSLRIFEEIGDDKRIALSLNNIGAVYTDMDDYSNALTYYFKSLELKSTSTDENDMAQTLNNIGTIYVYTNSYDKALETYLKSLAIHRRYADKEACALSYLNIGLLYNRMKQYGPAQTYLDSAITSSREIGSLSNLQSCYSGQYKLDSALGNYKEAFNHFVLFDAYTDSLFNTDNTRTSIEAEMNYEFEKKKKEAELEQARKDLAAEQALNRQKQQRNYFIAGFILVFVLAIFIFYWYRQNRKVRLSLAEKNRIIEEKNKDITDSINYAKKIQEAILPSKDIKYRLFPQAFVLFQPRDIVSGDFYWFTEKNGKKMIAAVDCTGHGVPGAFMSMIGNAFLNEIVNEKGITAPGEVLSELRHRVIQSLRQTGSDVQSKDGMDIALLAFSEDFSSVEYAGANNPLWRFRMEKGKWAFEAFEPNKRPIGYYMGRSLPFTTHNIPLQKGDTLYIFTDGFADQFGGPKGKKFKYRQLKEVLSGIQHRKMPEQEKILTDTFSSWKGQLDQVDDVLVIGIRT